MTDQALQFDNRVLVVTGAGRGLGRAYAIELAARGARVIVADNGARLDGAAQAGDPAAAVAREIADRGGVAAAYSADLASEDGAQGAVIAALDHFGRIDGVLHNASTVPDLDPVDQMPSSAIERVLDVNVKAGLWLARAAWPHFTAQRYGRLLFTTSAAIFGAARNAPYAAAKGAMVGMMRCLAVDGADHGVCVNAIAPSASTRMTEAHLTSAYGDWLRRTMPPEKIAGLAAYLMSDACAVTGEILAAGGGRIARITLAENDGVILDDPSAEAARDALPRLLADTTYAYPQTLGERSARVAALLGYEG